MIARTQRHLQKAEEFEAKAEQAVHESKKRIFEEFARTHRLVAASVARSRAHLGNEPPQNP